MSIISDNLALPNSNSVFWKDGYNYLVYKILSSFSRCIYMCRGQLQDSYCRIIIELKNINLQGHAVDFQGGGILFWFNPKNVDNLFLPHRVSHLMFVWGQVWKVLRASVKSSEDKCEKFWGQMKFGLWKIKLDLYPAYTSVYLIDI